MEDDPPGLVLRELLPCDVPGHVLVREVWNPKAPGCPLVVFDQTVWPWRVRTDVVTVDRRVRVHTAIADRFRFGRLADDDGGR